MKAIIWTDVTQSLIMFLGIVLSIIFGMIFTSLTITDIRYFSDIVYQHKFFSLMNPHHYFSFQQIPLRIKHQYLTEMPSFIFEILTHETSFY